MASVQQHVVSQFNDSEKAAIEEALKKAQSALDNNTKGPLVGQCQPQVAGHITNAQTRLVKLAACHDYVGKFVEGPPQTLGEGKFVHEGSEAYVKYGTSDQEDPELGYLLAWSKLAEDDCAKVYVEAGKRERIMSLRDSYILAKVKASGNISRYYDCETGAAAMAEIKDLGSNLAALASQFTRIIN